MAIGCRWLMSWVIVVTGLTLAAPVASASGGLTNPAVDNAQLEVTADQVAGTPLRDPFWPVGYWPVAKTGPAAASTVSPGSVPITDDVMKRALAMIRVGGIIRRGTKYFATVNGSLVEVGDAIPIMLDGNVVIFIVRSVDMQRIRIEPAQK